MEIYSGNNLNLFHKICKKAMEFNVSFLNFPPDKFDSAISGYSEIESYDDCYLALFTCITALSPPFSHIEKLNWIEKWLSENEIKNEDVLSLMRFFSHFGFDEIPFMTRVYFLSLIEGDDLNSNWLSLCVEKIRSCDVSLLEFFSLSFPSNISRGNEKKIPFFKNSKCLKKLHKVASSLYYSSSEFIVNRNDDYLKPRRNKKKVLFISGKPFPYFNTHADFLVHHLRHLDTELFEVSFLITGEASFETPWGDLLTLSNHNLTINKKIWLNANYCEDNFYPKENINCFYKSDAINIAKNVLSDINPDVTIFIGGVYESKVFRRSVSVNYPVVLLPTTTNVENHLGKPDNYFDIIWVRNQAHHEALRVKNVAEEKLYRMDLSVTALPEAEIYEWPFSKELLNKKLVCSVLGHGRLSKSVAQMSKAYKKLFVEFLKNNNVVWFFVGESEKQARINFKNDKDIISLLGDKIICIQHVNNLRGFYAYMNLLFVFPVTGGGGAVSRALNEELPTVCYIKNDSVVKVPPDNTYSFFEDGIVLIDKILNSDLDLIKENIRIYRSKFDVESSMKEYSEMLFKAIENFECRANE